MCSKAEIKLPPHSNCDVDSFYRGNVFNIPRFSTLSLSVVWVFGFVMSITAAVLADAFQGSAPTFPFGPMANLAMGLNILCALFSMFLGYSLWDSYSVYQPFAGGEKYVLLQFCGWTLVTASSTFMMVYLLQLNPPVFRYGALTVLEGFASLGNILLLLSLRSFTPSKARPRSQDMLKSSVDKTSEDSILKMLLCSPNSETGLVIIFLCAQCFLCAIGVLFRFMASPVMVIFIVFHVVNGVLIYFVIAWERNAGYKLFQGPMETLFFLLPSLMYLFALAGGIVIVRMGTDSPQLAFGLTALAAFLGISSTLALVRTMQLRDNNSQVDFVVANYGRYIFSLMATFLACIPVSVVYYVGREEGNIEKTGYEKVWVESLLFCQSLSVIFLLILIPATHLIGRVIYGDVFSFFQPFRGSAGFVILQGLGWASFSASVLCMTFHMTATNFLWILSAAATGIMGQFFIHFSIEAFAFESSYFSSLAKGQSTDETRENGGNAEGQTILNGELIVSLLLQLTSIILRLVVDIAMMQPNDVPSVPKNILVTFASLAFMVSVPLAHYSGTRQGILLFAPFQGNGTYIALQALGWTAYALFVLEILVICVFFMNGTNSDKFLYEHLPFFSLTLEGLLQMVPLLLIVFSVVIEARHSVSRRRGRDIVMEALELVKATLQDKFDTCDESEQTALQMAMQILASTSLSAYGMQYDRHCFRLNREMKTPCTIVTETEIDTQDEEDTQVEMDKQKETFSVLSRMAETRHGPATLLVLMMCLSSASGYIIAALWTTTMPLVGFVFAVVGFAACTISCVTTHCVYGVVLHGSTGEYTFFMPFRGGSVYVALQIAGWVSYACAFIVTLMHTMENVRSYITLPAGAFFSVCSQFFILFSVPKFSSRYRRKTYLEENGEGVVGILVFVGAFLFAYIYIRAQLFFQKIDDIILDVDGYTAPTSGRPRVPFFIIAISIVAVVPFFLITLSRSVKRCLKVSQTYSRTITANDEDEDDEMLERHSTRIAYGVVRMSEIMMLLLGTTTPMGFMFLVYYLVHSHYQVLFSFVEYWFQLTLFAGGVAFLLSLLSHALSIGMIRRLIYFRQCFLACALYSTAVICFIILFGPMFILPFYSVGAYYTAFTTLFLTLGAKSKKLRLVLRLTVYAMLGYATYLECLRVNSVVTICSAFMTLLYYAVDVGLLLFWLWYLPLYDGHPEETGALRSPTFTRWAEKYIFSNVERYFNFRVIQEDASVNMRDSNNQYIFSFHPHGVFACTALFCRLTKAWRQKIGYNDKTYVVTHAASILFNIPLARDLGLRLGALAVTHSVIQRSLVSGNSAIIVSGGQAELLLTERGNMIMSIVTYHHGFIKLALRHKIPLVPLLSFCEQNIMSIFRLPTVQRVTLRLFGFPFPMFFYGRWLLPFPHPTPLTIVVGSPVTIPPGARADNPKDVIEVADAYFSALRELFYKHRAAAGYPNMELVYHSKKEKKVALGDSKGGGKKTLTNTN